MIDLNDLRTRPNCYQDACKIKGITFSVEAFLELDRQHRSILTEFEIARAEQNKLSKSLPTLKDEDKRVSLASMKILAQQVKDLSSTLKPIQEKWAADQLRIPSIPDNSVPHGKDDSENVEIRSWGAVPPLTEKPDDHITLGSRFKLFDIERGVKVAGARSYFLQGDGARLQNAVFSLARDLIHKKGYTLMEVPHVVLRDAMVGTGYFPGGEDQAFTLDERDKDHHLIGTSEVSVCSYHMNEVLNEADLPKRYAGQSPCYRREAGAYGRDTHGLYRVHQFYKIEQVIICRADKSESAAMHAELLGNAEELMQVLQLPYRVVAVCTGDMGQGQVIKHDIEAWMPSRKGYGETHSCSTFFDFQSRRLKLRYKTNDGANHFCYTLNNTLVASPRILIALIENNQQKDGRIKIPSVLRPYLNGQEYLAE
jgi:seryl-tRNA synthetase